MFNLTLSVPCSTVVEHSTHKQNIEHSNPAQVKEKMASKIKQPQKVFNSESKVSDIKRAYCYFLNMRGFKTIFSIVFFQMDESTPTRKIYG
jgi:hypothetical protein